MQFFLAVVNSALLLTSSLAAQSVSMQIEALTPLTLTEVVGGTATTSTVPAGALGPFGSASSGTSTRTYAALSWWSSASATETRISLAHNLTAAVGDTASAGPHELLVTITPNNPSALVLADLAISRFSGGSPGAPEASIAFDLNNDGTFESTNLLGFYMPLPINGAPVVMRIVFYGSALPGTSSGNSLYFDVRPRNALTILDAAVPCVLSYPPLELYAQPVFANYGISLSTSTITDPVVLLLGLSPQPFLLPTPAPVPCLVVPSPDVALLSLSGNSVGIQVDIPFTVRPATLYAQAVQLSPIGLVTSRAVRVGAQ